MKNSASKSIRVSVETTENHGLRYFTIYEVKGVNENDDRVVIERFYKRENAEGCMNLYDDCKLYKTVYIMEQTVWVD